MMPNVAKQFMSDLGEIFSHGATSSKDEKTVETPAIAPLPGADAEGDVTLISNNLQPCHAAEKFYDADFLSDLQHLKAMQLREKYRREATSHRLMLSRSKRRGNTVHPALWEFRSFLKVVGPMPVSRATLDRIDNSDRDYAPGKVRWADKRTQNNNKADTLTFHDQRTGEVFTASRLAKMHGVSPSAIRKRFERGWSDTEIIMNARSSGRPLIGQQLAPPPLPPSEVQHRRKPTYGKQSSEPRPMSWEELAFARAKLEFEATAAEFAAARAKGEEEPLLATPSVMNEDLPLGVSPVTDESFLRRFRMLWPSYRPHTKFSNASSYHQHAIELIDPDYVKNERAKIIEQGETKTKL